MSKSFADMASGLISSASKTEQESAATVAAPKRGRKPKAGTDLMNEYQNNSNNGTKYSILCSFSRFFGLSISGNETFRAAEKNAFCFLEARGIDGASRRLDVTSAAEIRAE